MSTNFVWLAILMAAVTYPSRALPLITPGIERLPRIALEYLRLVGPSVLSALAAVSVGIALDAARHPSLHIGFEWVAVVACVAVVAWRRNLLLGLLVAVGLVAAVRAVGAPG
jgi:branched-subunit amino acid transport protein